MSADEEVIRARDVVPEPIAWLWNGHVPEGMLTLVAGRPGEGKSLFAAYLAAEISQQGIVIFSNMEDPLAHVVRPRLEASGTDLNNVIFANFRLPKDLGMLEGLVEAHAPKLIVMDPIAAHLTASIYNDQDVRTVLTPLGKLAAEHKLGVVAIHHTVKNTTRYSHPLRAIGGSGGGLAGAARAVYVFGTHPGDSDERVLAPVKFNLGPMPKSAVFEMDDHEWVIGDGMDAELISAGRLVFVKETKRLTATHLLLQGGQPGFVARKAMPKRERAAEFVTHYLALGPRPVEELREDGLQAGLTWHTTRRAADDIGVLRIRRGFGTGSFTEWALPLGHPGLVVNVCTSCMHDEGEHLTDQGCLSNQCNCTEFEEK